MSCCVLLSVPFSVHLVVDRVGCVDREIKVTTPFGDPSDNFFLGRVGDNEVVFLPRHGRGHRYTPTEVNYRANVFGLKLLQCKWVIGVSAVGSLQEEIDMGHLILIDQFIDKTKHRKDSFFGDGIVAHAPFSEPCCKVLRDYLLQACEKVKGERDLTGECTVCAVWCVCVCVCVCVSRLYPTNTVYQHRLPHWHLLHIVRTFIS